MGAPGIAVLEQAESGFAQLEPGAFRAVGGASSRSRRARPSQPLPTKSSPRNDQQSHPIQTATRAAETLVAAGEVGAIGALAGVEDDVGEIEPPGGKPQALERLGIFLGL